MKNDCSVIVLSYNTKNVTEECLKRVGKQADEVIVLDNGSTDGSAEMIRGEFPGVKLIVSKENTGFARGNNICMAKAKSKYLLLLNTDTYIEKDTVKKAIEYMDNNPECSVAGCELRYEDGSFQNSAGELPTPWNTFLWMMFFVQGVHPKNKTYFDKDKRVGWVMGAFMLIRREVYEKTGGFDEKYFMYGEEVEWCKRIKDAGIEIWYTPKFNVTHLGQASAGGDISKSIIRELEGLKYYFLKHYPDVSGLMIGILRVGVLIRILLKSGMYREALERL